MNIFSYFKASGKVYYLDERRQRTFWKVPGGVNVIPWDGSYTQWISESFYDRGQREYGTPEFYSSIKAAINQLESIEFRPSETWIDSRDIDKFQLVTKMGLKEVSLTPHGLGIGLSQTP